MNSVSVAVMQPIEHRSGDDPAFQFVCQLGSRLAESGWDVLINPVPFIYSSRDDLLEVALADFCHS